MDLSHSGQSRDGEGRRPAAHPGLGAWVGARVASPRGAILRPGCSSRHRVTAPGHSQGIALAQSGAEGCPRNCNAREGSSTRTLSARRMAGAARYRRMWSVVVNTYIFINFQGRIVRDEIAII